MVLKTNMVLWMLVQNVGDCKVTLAITSKSEPYLTMWIDGKYEADKYLFGKPTEKDKCLK